MKANWKRPLKVANNLLGLSKLCPAYPKGCRAFLFLAFSLAFMSGVAISAPPRYLEKREDTSLQAPWVFSGIGSVCTVTQADRTYGRTARSPVRRGFWPVCTVVRSLHVETESARYSRRWANDRTTVHKNMAGNACRARSPVETASAASRLVMHSVRSLYGHPIVTVQPGFLKNWPGGVLNILSDDFPCIYDKGDPD